MHVFHKNNELAGYCSVLQALELTGSTGDYGRRLSAVVIGFGATARGAVTALNAHGVHDVHVLTNRGVAAVGSPIHSVQITQFDHDERAPYLSNVITDAAGCRWRPSSPSATSSSTARCRTPTTRSCTCRRRTSPSSAAAL